MLNISDLTKKFDEKVDLRQRPYKFTKTLDKSKSQLNMNIHEYQAKAIFQ